MNYIPLIMLGVLLNAAAQLLLKNGMLRIGYFTFSWNNIGPIGWQLATSPSVLAGLFAYVISVVVWLLVLSRVDVSYAYPLLSVGYIVNAIGGYYLFHEDVSLTRISGIVIIIAGVYLVSRS